MNRMAKEGGCKVETRQTTNSKDQITKMVVIILTQAIKIHEHVMSRRNNTKELGGKGGKGGREEREERDGSREGMSELK